MSSRPSSSSFGVSFFPSCPLRPSAEEEPSHGLEPTSAAIGLRLVGRVASSAAQRLDEQGHFYTTLPRGEQLGPAAEVAYSWRYIADPTANPRTPQRMQLIILARVTDWSRNPAELERLCRDLGVDLAELLAATLPGTHFVPLARPEEVAYALSPFEPADLVELRAGWATLSEHVSLPLPMPGAPSVEPITAAMRRCEARCMLAIDFSPAQLPTPMLGGESHTFASSTAEVDVRALLNTVASMDFAPDSVEWSSEFYDPSSGRERADAVARAMAHAWATQRLLALRQPFHFAVRLASAGHLNRALVNLASSEFSGPGQLVKRFWSADVTGFDRPVEPVVPRVTSSAPAVSRRKDYDVARANLDGIRFALWGEHLSAAVVEPLPRMSGDVSLALLAGIVSVRELARLAPLPDDAAWLIQRHAVRELPFIESVTSGMRLGVNRGSAYGELTPVHWPAAGRRSHAVLEGATGSGKTTLAKNMILSDIKEGRGVVVIDPHDQLVEDLLQLIPARRRKDVILFDAADHARPMAINPLDLDTKEKQSQFTTSFLAQLVALYDRNQLGMVGPMAMQALRNGLQAIMGLPHGGTLLEVFRLLDDDDFLTAVLPHVPDLIVRRGLLQYRAMLPTARAELVTHFLSKISEWVADPVMQHIVGQRHSAFDFTTALNNQSIVLCQLRSGTLGTDKAAFLGHTLLPMIYQSALSRMARPPRARKPCSLYIDEAGTFTGERSLARMLAECRKAELSVTLIYQQTSQADAALRDAIFANCGSIFAFRSGPVDAMLMEQLFAPSPITATDLLHLPRGVAFSTIMMENGERSAPFTLQTELLSDRASERVAAHIREASRQRYGTAREAVDAAIARRSSNTHRWLQHGDD